MRGECVLAVTRAAAALGKTLTQADLANIEARIRTALRLNAVDDPAAMAKLTPAERLQQAAERAARDILHDKQRDAVNVARQITATTKNVAFIDRMIRSGLKGLDAVARLLLNHEDSKANVASIEQNTEGLQRQYRPKLAPIVKATERYMGFWTNRGAVRDFVRELYGEPSGNAAAKEAARVWRDEIAEPLRKKANEVGANIGKLKDWAMPQHHSREKVERAGVAKWIGDILPKLNRDAYVNEDGTRMNDAQLKDVLQRVWRTIVSDGASDMTPGAQHGAGSIKNRGSEHRALHFDTADGYMDYQAKYGERSVLETLAQHIDSKSREIAVLQTLGPNAEHAYKYLADYAQQKMFDAGTPYAEITKQRKVTDNYANFAMGKFGPVANPAVAKRYAGLKSFVVATKLGTASVSAITDQAMVHNIALANHIPQSKAFTYQLRALVDKGFRDFVRAQGHGVETITHQISRYGEEVFGHGIPSQLANVMFRISGLNAKDSALRIGVGAMLMDNYGTLTRKHATLADLHPDDNHVLLSRGVTDADWAVWKAAQLDDHMLTPHGISQIPDAALAHVSAPVHVATGTARSSSRLITPEELRQNAIQKLIGATSADVALGVPMPTLKNRADWELRMGSVQRGTHAGELFRSILQFKGFPLSILVNNYTRAMAMPTTAGKLQYAAVHLAGTLIMGGIVVQIKAMLMGQNPQDMSDPKFAGRAMVQGGTVGLYGDLVLNPLVTDYKTDLSSFEGPVLGTAGDLYRVAQTAYRSLDPTKRSDLPGELVRLVKSNTPFQNLWYTKAVTDHLIFQSLQDYLSPGYAQRMEQRAQREFGSSYYWPPATAPNQIRPPDFTQALGK